MLTVGKKKPGNPTKWRADGSLVFSGPWPSGGKGGRTQ